MKLNVGAGGHVLLQEEGWINIDINPGSGIDMVLDLEENDLPFDKGSAEYIMMRDFIEHLSRARQEPFLRNAYDVLAPRGWLYLQTPDLETTAKRYLDVLENPTELQHPLDAEQVAGTLFGGQEYRGNFHKHVYDAKSLRHRLESIGFAIKTLNSDGGMNLLCTAEKSQETVYLAIGGGLGDAIQVYLASPANREDGSRTSDQVTSLWFRRLPDFKQRHPGKRVRLYICSHNPSTRELFEFDPYIDEIVNLGWRKPQEGDGDLWREDKPDATCLDAVFLTSEYNPVPATIYMPPDEQVIVKRIKDAGEYIAIHPFAGSKMRCACSITKYKEMVDGLVDFGYKVVVLGSGYRQHVEGGGGEEFFERFEHQRDGVISLVGKVSARISTSLVLQASGFIGTHSAMLLPAWHMEIPSVCIVPPVHDDQTPWDEFFATTNPVTWAADKPFHKTVIVNSPDEVDVGDVVEFICR